MKTGITFGGSTFVPNDTIDAINVLALGPDQSIYFIDANTAAAYSLTAFGRDLADSANAGAALDSLGVSAFVQTILNDADGDAVLASLGATAFGIDWLKLANAAAGLAELGAMSFTVVSDTASVIVFSFVLGATTYYFQMGQETDLAANSIETINFPQAFATRCFAMASGGTSNTATEGDVKQYAYSLTQLSVSNSGGAPADYGWWAVGY